VSFAVATAFHLEYRRPAVSVLAYSLAVLAGWSRIHDDYHWASDVFVGAALGTAVTRGVYRSRRLRAGAGRAAGGWHAYVTPSGLGARLSF